LFFIDDILHSALKAYPSIEITTSLRSTVFQMTFA